MAEEYTIIDVREPFEYNMGHISNAVNIPAGEITDGSKELEKIPKDAKIIVYCRSGSRSVLVLPILQSLGYTNVINGINQQMVTLNFGIH